MKKTEIVSALCEIRKTCYEAPRCVECPLFSWDSEFCSIFQVMNEVIEPEGGKRIELFRDPRFWDVEKLENVKA